MSKSSDPVAVSGWRRFLGVAGLLALGIGISLVGGEVFLRLFRPQIYDIHPRGMYSEDPDLGYRLTPGFEGTLQRSEFSKTARIGPGGLRDWDGEAKRPGTFRILVLGDSQAFGLGVGDDETFAARLKAILTEVYPDREIEVVNAGIPGFGTADELALLCARGEQIAPDLVILQFLSVNDLAENLAPAVTWATVRDGMLTARSQPSISDWNLVDAPRRMRRFLKLHSHLFRLVSDSVGYLAIRLGWSGARESLWGEDFTAEEAALGERLLVDLAETGRRLGAETLFLYTTGQAHVLDGTSDTLRSREVLAAAARASGSDWLDVAAAMSDRADRLDLYYRKDGHWTPAGHQALAEILAGYLENEWTGSLAADRTPPSESVDGAVVN